MRYDEPVPASLGLFVRKHFYVEFAVSVRPSALAETKVQTNICGDWFLLPLQILEILQEVVHKSPLPPNNVH